MRSCGGEKRKYSSETPSYLEQFQDGSAALLAKIQLLKVSYRNTCLENSEVYFFRDHFEIDVVSGNYKIELKSRRAHRRYPKDVILLKEEDVPYFLIRLFQT